MSQMMSDPAGGTHTITRNDDTGISIGIELHGIFDA